MMTFSILMVEWRAPCGQRGCNENGGGRIGRWVRALLKGLGLLRSSSTDRFAVVSEHVKPLTVCLFSYTGDKGSLTITQTNCLCKGSETTAVRGATSYRAPHMPTSSLPQTWQTRDEGLQHMNSVGIAATHFWQDGPAPSTTRPICLLSSCVRGRGGWLGVQTSPAYAASN